LQDKEYRQKLIKRIQNVYDKLRLTDISTSLMMGKSAKARLKKRMNKAGYKPFNYHSLKAHGAGDYNGDILEATGHRDPKMRKVYDRKKKIVPATR
jgi:hypothetical protein